MGEAEVVNNPWQACTKIYRPTLLVVKDMMADILLQMYDDLYRHEHSSFSVLRPTTI
jgi:hypothetical protein